MRSTAVIITLASCIATILADCNDAASRPDIGEIRFYAEENCNGYYYNVGALNSCQSWIGGDFGSAITRSGIKCQIYATDGCNNYIDTIDAGGWRKLNKDVQAVYCFDG